MKEKINPYTLKDCTSVSDKSDVTLSADSLENCFETCYRKNELNANSFVFLPGFIWDGGIKETNRDFGKTEKAEFFLVFENAIT